MVSQDPADGSIVKRVPLPEKRLRQESQRARLVGLDITAELEPAHQLIDLVNHQYESGILVSVPPSRCAKRESEILAGFKDKQHTLKVEESVIKLGSVQAHVECDASDSLRVQLAWMRRGLAMDQCRLVSWACHQKWIQRLMDSLSQVRPPGYMQISLAQCMRADKELFFILARETSPPYKVNSAGVSPLDSHLSRLVLDPRITQYLLLLPKSQASAASVKVDAEVDDPPASAKAKGKAKAKAKRRNRQVKSVPEELKQYKTRADKGECVCWSFNMQEGCPNGKGGKCNKGLHVCANCRKPEHSVLTYRSKGGG